MAATGISTRKVSMKTVSRSHLAGLAVLCLTLSAGAPAARA